MTEIRVSNASDQMYGISIKGHAEYADIGKDIVCSAVSVLTFSLYKFIKEMEEQGKTKILEQDIEEGNFNIVFEIKDKATIYGINAIIGGFELVAENYKEYVKFPKR